MQISGRAGLLGPENNGKYPSEDFIARASGSLSAQKIVQVYSAGDGKVEHIRVADATVAGRFTGPLGVTLQSYSDTTTGCLCTRRRRLIGTAEVTIDTSAATIGDPVYLGASGAWSLTVPAGLVAAKIGHVSKVHATLGEVFLAPNDFKDTWIELGATAVPGSTQLVSFTIADGGTSTAWAAPRACTIIDAWTVKLTAIGGGSSDVTLKAGSDTVSVIAVDGVAVGGVTRATALDTTHRVLVASESITIVGSGDTSNAATLYMLVAY